MGEIMKGEGVSWEKVPDMTPEEEAALLGRGASPDSAVAQRTEQMGGPDHVRQLAEDLEREREAQEAGDARGPQREEGRSAGDLAEEEEPGQEPEAEAEQPEAPAFDVDAWDTARLFDPQAVEAALGEVPEAMRPVVERVVRAVTAREEAARATYEAAVAAREESAKAVYGAVVASVEKLRDERIIPLLTRLENAGVLDAQKVVDEITDLVNETVARSEREETLERELMLHRWDAFTRDEPNAQRLLAAAGRDQKRWEAAPEGKRPPRTEAQKALATFREAANKLPFSDAWAVTARRHPAAVAALGRPAAPATPAAPAPAAPTQPPAQAASRPAPQPPPPAPAVARKPPVQPAPPPSPPPGRMQPRASAPPPSRGVTPARTAATEEAELDQLLAEGWASHKQQQGGW